MSTRPGKGGAFWKGCLGGQGPSGRPTVPAGLTGYSKACHWMVGPSLVCVLVK